MNDLYTYCITHKNFNFLNSLNINIIGSGNYSKNDNFYHSKWYKDDMGENISFKNKNFGTLTTHYWFWKNQLSKHKKNDWISFCHYRRFWVNNDIGPIVNIKDLKENLLTKMPKEFEKYESFLPKKVFVNKVKFMKLIKKGYKNYLKDPTILFSNKKNDIELHFDMFHGYKNLSRAIEVMPLDDRKDFDDYKKRDSFYPFQIFICKPNTLLHLYKKTFEWIFECEKIFKNHQLIGYGQERMYDFLAERFFSFYFEKYTRIKVLPYSMIEKFDEL